MPATPLQIGDWLLEPATLRLRRGARSQRLPRLQFDLLLFLVAHAGELVTREQLIDAVWQRRVVSDEVLSRQVASLRQALGDDAREPRYIETIPKAGYRLVARVGPPATIADSHPAESASGSSGSPSTPRGSARTLLRLGFAAAIAASAVGAWQARGPRAQLEQWNAAALAHETPLASDPAWESMPRLSRDGRWLAYGRSEPQSRMTALWLARADGGGARQLVDIEGAIAGLAFAPAADAIAVLARDAGRCRVLRFALPAGPLHTLAECGPGQGLDWSADGKTLLFSDAAANAAGAHPLLELSLDSGRARVASDPGPGEHADSQARWSPDGMQLAFARGASGEQQLLIGPARGGGVRNLGPADRNRVGGLAWSSDGRQILAALDAGGYPALHALDVAAGRREQIGGRGAAALDIGTGGLLVYEQRRYDANIWWQALDAPAPARRISASSRFDAQPALSPDGGRVAYVSARDAASAVWIADLAGGEQRLPLDVDAIWNRPAWAADGRSLLLTHYRDGRPTIARHWLDSGRTELLDPDGREASAALFAGDGGIVFASRENGRSLLLRWTPGGSVQALPGSIGVTEFRAGRSLLAWQVAGSPGLRVLRADGTLLPATSGLPDELPLYAWGFAGDQLVFQQADGEQFALWAWDAGNGALRRIGMLPAATASGPNLAVDATLRFALVARIDAAEADLLRARVGDGAGR
jgi:DNA-binding winged helix-turn-helix (wHTH) protein/Tol biopolymer transport system component